MQIPVVLILFAIVNVVYVPSTQQNIHSNYVYDRNTVNKVDNRQQHIYSVEVGPWRGDNDILDASERFSGTTLIYIYSICAQ